jgi:hypothetical protein
VYEIAIPQMQQPMRQIVSIDIGLIGKRILVTAKHYKPQPKYTAQFTDFSFLSCIFQVVSCAAKDPVIFDPDFLLLTFYKRVYVLITAEVSLEQHEPEPTPQDHHGQTGLSFLKTEHTVFLRA